MYRKNHNPGYRFCDGKPELPFGDSFLVIADRKVCSLYPEIFANRVVLSLNATEKEKTLQTMELVYRWLVEKKADRHSTLVGVGGGIICDIAGFAAATFMRGMPLILYPTTLLAQTDAALGGKSGVNLDGYKNMIGSVQLPEMVNIYPEFLASLPKEEFSNGMAEVIKHATIASEELFETITATIPSPEGKSLKHDILHRSVEIKNEIVGKDLLESGARKMLNFGHTFGHAIERQTGMKHGWAVSIGMNMAAGISVRAGLLSTKDAESLKKLLVKNHLPVDNPVPLADLLDVIRKDKKKNRDEIDFVFLKKIGVAMIQTISFNDLEKLAK
jgi:3-dehydroquinate synthase